MATIGIIAPATWAGSAYAIQAKEISERLKADGHTVIVLGNQHYSAPIDYNGVTVTPRAQDDFLRDIFGYWVEEYKIDVIVTIFNFWVLEYLPEMKKRYGFKYIIWTPVEGELNKSSLLESQHEVLRNADAIISDSEFVQEQIRNVGYGSTVVRSGVSGKLQRLPVLENRKRHNVSPDTFMVGFVGRNYTERKLIPYIMMAFRHFLDRLPADEQEKCVLYLHTNREYGARMYDINRMAGYMGLNKKVLLPARYLSIDPLDDEQMNELYNLFDVMMFPSMGEGLNVPLMEAMYLGIPCIVNDAHAHKELIRDTNLIAVPPVLPYFPLISNMIEKEYLPNPVALGEALLAYYEEWIGNKGIAYALAVRGMVKAKEWTWDNAYKGFKAVLDKVLDKKDEKNGDDTADGDDGVRREEAAGKSEGGKEV